MPTIKSSADLRNNYNEISTFCHNYPEPVFITKNGKGDLAVMSIEAYEELTSRFELYSQIKEGMMSTLKSKIGALLAKPALKKTLKKFDASEYGGAPLLGLNGLVVKAHGSATAKEMKNAIVQCIAFAEEDITQKIKDQIVKGDRKSVV